MDSFTHFLIPFIILSFLKVKDKLSGALGGISIDFDFFYCHWFPLSLTRFTADI
jgi:hypothetical protein